MLADYYKRRAAEYDRIYFKPERQRDLRAMEAWLPTQFGGRDVLEVACGTGWWTQHGARDAARWLATDINDETMQVARAKPMPACVTFATADARTFAELRDRTFDAAFHGHWWSHVPRAGLADWIASLHARLRPGARVVALDNAYVDGSSSPIVRTAADGDTFQQRRLDDGSMHEVLKNFPTREEALAAVGPRARDVEWIAHAHYWVLAYTLA